MEDLELGEYADAFEENCIDAKVPSGLTNDDLEDISVMALGGRHNARDSERDEQQ